MLGRWRRWRDRRRFRRATAQTPTWYMASRYPDMGGAYGPNWPAGSAPDSPPMRHSDAPTLVFLDSEAPLLTQGQRMNSGPRPAGS